MNTYGTFSLSGEILDVSTENGVPAFQITQGNLSLYYNYVDTMLLNSDKDSWHLINDKSKKIDDIKLNENIMKGAIIIQTSTDKLNWIDVTSITDAFNETPIRTESLYETTDVQLINGCYYRIIVAYELRIRTEDSNIFFINTDKYDYKKCAEVYEFYAYRDVNSLSINTKQTHSLGSKVKVNDFDSYYGEKTIDKGDPHYGWELGNFYVSGFTDKTKDNNGDMVFLKNVGDKVTLWFHLNENINKLNNNKNLSITADEKGSDQYFETSTMNFGRGALIIRYTDYNDVKSKPIIYTNYLEANTSIETDTMVSLFEEGDYEVALDYEITNDQLIDKSYHYRIFFKFSIRNGNCMVYPFDVSTGNELSNSSMTENGFLLDLAKSRYLKVYLKREVLTESADGLIEDTRFNGPAKEGEKYTEEGIYTITVNNIYTQQFTVKKIYVGANNILKAYMTTGLSIPEINNLVSQGATIFEDGSIQFNSQSNGNINKDDNSENSLENNKYNNSNNRIVLISIGLVAICVLIVAIAYVKKKKSI